MCIENVHGSPGPPALTYRGQPFLATELPTLCAMSGCFFQGIKTPGRNHYVSTWMLRSAYIKLSCHLMARPKNTHPFPWKELRKKHQENLLQRLRLSCWNQGRQPAVALTAQWELMLRAQWEPAGVSKARRALKIASDRSMEVRWACYPRIYKSDYSSPWIESINLNPEVFWWWLNRTYSVSIWTRIQDSLGVIFINSTRYLDIYWAVVKIR